VHVRITQARAQFLLDPHIGQAPRFQHEGQQHRRHRLFQFGARQPRRPRQVECIRHGIEVLAHFQVGVVHRVVDPIRASAKQRQRDQPGEIVGVDVVGVDIVGGTERRRALLQAFNRQAVFRIDAGRAQDRQARTGAPGPVAQGGFRIHPAPRAGVLWLHRVRLVHPFALAIAVHATGTDINESRAVG